jgi:hypothetical protein
LRALKLLTIIECEVRCRYFTKCFYGSLPKYAIKTIDTINTGGVFVGSLLLNITKDDSMFYVSNPSPKVSITN